MSIENLLNAIFSDSEINIKDVFDKKISEYNLSKTKALKLLNIDKDVFEEILNGTAKQPNLIHIVKIAEFLDVDVNNFINVVLKNQSIENIASIDNARKATFIVKNFDVKALTKLGFFASDFNTENLVEKVLNYFGYLTISEFEQQLNEPLYSRVKKNHSDKMKDFWIKSAYQTFRIINNPNNYNRERLKDLIVKIKPYSQDVSNGLLTVTRALYNIGVTVIFQNYLSTTQVRGATFIINEKPCIVITDFNKNYPTLWFTLLHELNHVLFDFDLIEKSSYHLSDDKDLFLIEDKANEFARNFFMSEDKFHYIKRYINNSYLVSKFANEIEVHPSIVYSFFIWYQKELYEKNYHAAFKEFYPDYSNAITKLNPITWNEASIKEASEKIKLVLELK
ncbi:ImmA/IrrE family metallo-endopeptidase [Chryseobacterium salviniae]|uniref:ImmA/IrrE family metallo-endopeptidase n=1 Tax=Chryseobacterium salviniae TaxID=3101750 RepID=A0ABU6HUP3_9FLAO|nr:ImmA/IrrE family metallo-endopeptidase [Chryseobacterium sp. T9W2-O]MEC3876796.1 ImmA/IrrE family metallo-endopeptidase [Chryseobacterium sp. T9W2-O]